MEITALNSKTYHKFLAVPDPNRSVLWNKWRVVVVKFHQITHFVMRLFRLQFEWVNAQGIVRNLSKDMVKTSSSEELAALYNTALRCLGRDAESIDYLQLEKSTDQEEALSFIYNVKIAYKVTPEMLEVREDPLLYGFETALTVDELNELLRQKFQSVPNTFLLPVVTERNLAQELNQDTLMEKIAQHNPNTRYLLVPCMQNTPKGPHFSCFVVDITEKTSLNFNTHHTLELNAIETKINYALLGNTMLRRNKKVPSNEDAWSSGYWVLFAFQTFIEGNRWLNTPQPYNARHILEYVEYRIHQLALKQNKLPEETEEYYKSLAPYKQNKEILLQTLKAELNAWRSSPPKLKDKKKKLLETIAVFIERERLWTAVHQGITSWTRHEKDLIQLFCTEIGNQRRGIARQLDAIAAS